MVGQHTGMCLQRTKASIYIAQTFLLFFFFSPETLGYLGQTDFPLANPSCNKLLCLVVNEALSGPIFSKHNLRSKIYCSLRYNTCDWQCRYAMGDIPRGACLTKWLRLVDPDTRHTIYNAILCCHLKGSNDSKKRRLTLTPAGHWDCVWGQLFTLMH